MMSFLLVWESDSSKQLLGKYVSQSNCAGNLRILSAWNNYLCLTHWETLYAELKQKEINTCKMTDVNDNAIFNTFHSKKLITENITEKENNLYS
jgi:hypothetical protein